jgi:alpha-tubulin suppressor-like RCC1 family protein
MEHPPHRCWSFDKLRHYHLQCVGYLGCVLPYRFDPLRLIDWLIGPGSNHFKQLGSASLLDHEYCFTPTVVLRNVASASAGSDHMCAALCDGCVMAWGRKRFGKCGTAETADHWDHDTVGVWQDNYAYATPVPIDRDCLLASLKAQAVVCGGNHTLVLATGK